MKIEHLALVLVLINFACTKQIINQNKLKCGQIEKDSSRIINGQVTGSKWPWHVGLFIKFAGEYKFFCAGSLISDIHVLTAAHCFDEMPFIMDIYIGAGLQKLSDAKPEVNLIKVTRRIKHENYDKLNNYENDIAILELSKAINFTNKISTICLPSSEDPKQVFNKSLQVVGWGSTKQIIAPDSMSNNLMELKIKIVNYYNETLCQHMDDLKYCGYDFEQKHSNLCVGDSGGSLLYSINDKWYAFGIVSFGNVEFENNSTLKCQNDLPTYFTIVPNYIDWINKIININYENTGKF